MKKLLNKFREERGQAMVIVALSLVVLLGATALSVDVGMQFNAKSKLQAAADAAALGLQIVLFVLPLFDVVGIGGFGFYCG